jgi:hypothetical protein
MDHGSVMLTLFRHPLACLLLSSLVVPFFAGCHNDDCVERTSPIVSPVAMNEYCNLSLYDPRLGDQSRVARYRVLAAAPDHGEQVCSTKKFDVVECETQQGPSPSYCVRGSDCLQIGFLGDQAFALKGFLGSDVYALDLECDLTRSTQFYPSLVPDAGPGEGDMSLAISCSVPL